MHARSILARLAWVFLSLALGFPASLSAQPSGAPVMPLDQIRPGMKGEVWTVFRGTHPQPFTVEVTGIIRNALGPGKDLILCKLTDPRVQDMGAVAGMSGSPLYIDGRLAGALSYQLQQFETVHYAGFTPISDLLEVSHLPASAGRDAPIPLRDSPPAGSPAAEAASVPPATSTAISSPFEPLTPVFNFSGVDPAVTALFKQRFRALGIRISAVGGSTEGYSSASDQPKPAPVTMRPGDSVSVALATGDVTIAGTGTISSVSGDHILAFGHPLMRLGAVDLPMASAEVVGILPSEMSSYKVVNVGRVIGTISQDRLSAVYGQIGRMPKMIPIDVTVPDQGSVRRIQFNVVRQPQLTPIIAAVGLAQGVLGSNHAGLAEGFRVRESVSFPGEPTLTEDSLYAGPQGFTAGLGQFVSRLGDLLQNPYLTIYPSHIAFSVEALGRNPTAVLDNVQLSRTTVSPGDTVQLTLTWQDYQGRRFSRIVNIPIAAGWTGRHLQVLVADGPVLDRLTGRPHAYSASEIRSFREYLETMSDRRRTDGLYVAVVQRASLFLDQARATVDYPGSIERIAHGADQRRYRQREGVMPLWEIHLLPGRLIPANVSRPLRVVD